MTETLTNLGKQLGIPGIAGVLTGELIVDLFAGGGGASLGLERALGRSPDIAINHDPAAIKMHAANHPATQHRCESIYDVDPTQATNGQPVGVLWASPDCRHFSKAKGGAPVSKAVRGLAWMIPKWAGRLSRRPRIIFMENVEEFRGWGPLVAKRDKTTGRVLKIDKSVAAVGEQVPIDQQQLTAGRRGKGRTFRRFVAQLEAMGYRVEHRILSAADFGAATIRKRLFLIARCDGQPIVWPEPTHGPKRSRPHRSAAEVIDFSLPCPSIFLTRAQARKLGVKRPLAPATCRRIAAGLVRFVLAAGDPFIIRCCHTGSDAGKVRPTSDPLSTVTSKNEHCLVVPTLVQTGYGEREGQSPRTLAIDAPLGTIVGGGGKHALVAAFLAKHYTQRGGVPMPGAPCTAPMPTITAVATQVNLCAAHLMVLRNNCVGSNMGDSIQTITTGGYMALVAAFLVAYYGSGKTSSDLREPMSTIVSKARLGLVTVTIQGQEYAVVDVGMRMLTPVELAEAQGLTPYILTGTKAEQIRRIGNSVCPDVAEAIARANLLPAALRRSA